MGSKNAIEFAQAVKDGDAQLDAALEWHFRSNHYPPLPYHLIPVAKQIIEAYQDGRIESGEFEQVDLPEGVYYRGETIAPVWKCIEAWHLHPFLEEA